MYTIRPTALSHGCSVAALNCCGDVYMKGEREREGEGGREGGREGEGDLERGRGEGEGERS